MNATVESPGWMKVSSLTLWRQRATGFFRSLAMRKPPRRLRLCESLSLGEKRFVAVIQFDGQQFLLGGGSGSVSLLARLGEAPDFAALLTEWSERQR